MGSTKSKRINKNEYKKVYSYVRRRPVYGYILDKNTTIETARVYFDNASEYEYEFNESYPAIPTITATAEDDSVNVFITSVSLASVTINTSELHTGYVDLHIMYVAE